MLVEFQILLRSPVLLVQNENSSPASILLPPPIHVGTGLRQGTLSQPLHVYNPILFLLLF